MLIYDPVRSGSRMTIVCFVSGAGTNYREIVRRDPNHDYLVFTNRPGCGGVAIARQNHHDVIELSHGLYMREARKIYGPGRVPRNCPERIRYEREACRLIERKLGGRPDLVCLAGYDQWLTDWTVEHYFPHILNVHPGDTTKGYDGLHWVPAAKAILAGEKTLRSTLFIVDKGEDTGPVLVQSEAVDIFETLGVLESRGTPGLHAGLKRVQDFSVIRNIKTFEDFSAQADRELAAVMETISASLQDILKVAGDWKIYPFAVHGLIASGRVEIDGRTVYIEGRAMPEYGYRQDEEIC
jgi:phosphoribosylglycinamide formyltransferase 1